MSMTGKFCTQCRAPLAPDAVFCPNCGARQDAPAPAATPTPPQQGGWQQPPPGYGAQGTPPGYPPQPGWQQPPFPPRRKGGGAVILVVVLLLLTAVVGGGYWAYDQGMLPEGIQAWVDERLGNGSDEEDSSDEEDADANDEEANGDEANADEKDASLTDESASVETDESAMETSGDATTQEESSASEQNGGIAGGFPGNGGTGDIAGMTAESLAGTWEGTLTFREINIPEEEQASMSEDDKAAMKAMIDSPMPLKFIFSIDESGSCIVDGVLSSPDYGESPMDTMAVSLDAGTVGLTYSDGSTDTKFTGTLSSEGGTLGMKGTFEILPLDGSQSGISGEWNVTLSSAGPMG